MENSKHNKPLNIDELIRQSLHNNNAFNMPLSFADKLTEKFKIRNMKRRLLTDWSIKLLIIVGITSILSITFFLTKTNPFNSITTHYLWIALAIIMIVFVFFFDQVILKLLFFIKDMKNEKLK